MGYYTNYCLKMEGKDAEEFFIKNKDKITEVINSTDVGQYWKGYYDYEYVFDACFGGYETKWYAWEKHMRGISLAFPDETFMLAGIGEGPIVSQQNKI